MKTTDMNYTPIQLKLPVDMERIIEINDSVYAFNEVVSHIDPKKYFVEREYKATGRPRYEREKLLKVLLLRMNRSIQSEGTYGEIKANRGYGRFRRRGINKAILEIALISCGFNLHKYHLSRIATAKPDKEAG